MDNHHGFTEGQIVIYKIDDADSCEIGRIKSLRDDGAFVFYHCGDTAAKTAYDHLLPITNDYCITGVSLGGQ